MERFSAEELKNIADYVRKRLETEPMLKVICSKSDYPLINEIMPWDVQVKSIPDGIIPEGKIILTKGDAMQLENGRWLIKPF